MANKKQLPELDLSNPVVVAVLPLKQDAMTRAAQEAYATVDRVKAELAAANNDLNIAAPYPTGWDAAFHAKYARYKLFSSLTEWRKGSYSHHEPMYADVTPKTVKQFIEEARTTAAEFYDAFVRKLVIKIGQKPAAATLDGNHVWGYSFLTVTLPNGTQQIWKTQTIMNISKLGKPFPQFPTRIVKAKG